MDLFELAERPAKSATGLLADTVSAKVVVEAIEIAGEKHEVTEPAAEVAAPPALRYTAAWREFRVALDELEACAGKCNATLNNTFGRGAVVGCDVLKYLEAARSEIFDNMIGWASSRFAAAGSKLEISSYVVAEALGPVSGRRQEHRSLYGGRSYEEEQMRLNDAFDPDAIWSYLEQQYGGDAGARATLAQVAKRLFSAFWMERNQPTEVSGKLKLELHAYSEDSYSSGGGKRYSYSTQDSIRKALHDLGAFALWAEDDETGRSLQSRFNSIPEKVQTRAKYQYGTGVYCVTYQTKIEVFFSPALGQKFRLFIAEFGPDDE